MDKLKVQAIFKSIDGEVNGFEGAGELTAFIRLKECNLRCEYCDTKYAQEATEEDLVSVEEIIKQVEDVPKVTITGGEPLVQDIVLLLVELVTRNKKITIETNGSVDLPDCFYTFSPNIRWVVDYKLPSSGMEEKMKESVFKSLRECDVIKFVISDDNDYKRALQVIALHPEWKAKKAFSPVIRELGTLGIDVEWPRRLAEKMLEDNLYNIHYSLQLHKVLWPCSKQER